MQRIGVLALCAILAASVLPPLPAWAQDAAPAAAPARAKAASQPRRRKPAAQTRAAVPAQATPAADSYQLVPSRTGSALSRARQNSFGTPDADPAPSGGSRRIGVGLGGANGTSPGMAIGF